MEKAFDLGMQPISNRYLSSPVEQSVLFPLILLFCPTCALPQIGAPIPPAELKPRFDWITYREPERHLDRMVDEALAKSGLSTTARIGGISYKDTSTLERLRRKGFADVWQIAPIADLGATSDHAEMETVQQLLNETRATAIVQQYGTSDLIIARHVIEHTHHTHAFMRAIGRLLKPGGTVLLEAPDFGRCRDLLDYTSIWEEHILYFNLQTLAALVASLGFDLIHAVEYPYPLENALAVIAQKTTTQPSFRPASALIGNEKRRWVRFVQAFEKTRQHLRNQLEKIRASCGHIVLFGAGHTSCTFLNLFQVADLIDFVADNDQCKIGLFMPGSRLPILPSDELLKRKIACCLLCLRPESEDKVRQSHQAFTQAGGVFISVFPENSKSIFGESAL